MRDDGIRGVRRFVACFVAATLLFCIPMFALQRDRTLSQMQHTAWTMKDGAPTQVSALAQTTDGYLWIGSWRGLFRFDGMSFLRYEPPAGVAVPSPYVFALMATPEGGLWISFNPSGVAYLKDGRLQLFSVPGELPRSHVFCFARDPDGRIWAGTQTGLLWFDGARWRDAGSDWNFENRRVWATFVDRDGTLWVSTDKTILFLRRGGREFQRTGLELRAGAPHLGQSADGEMWMSEFGGPLRPIPGLALKAPAGGPEIQTEGHFLFDRAGSIWLAGERVGVARMRFPERAGRRRVPVGDPELETFAERDGLTENSVGGLLEDREGNLWIGTGKGLDRFSQRPFVPVKLPASRRNFILLAGEDGDVWAGNASNAPMLRIHPNGGVHKDEQQMVAVGGAMEFASVCRDARGVAWWGVHGGVVRQDKNGFRFFPQPKEFPFDYVWEVAADNRNGGLWVRLGDVGLLHFDDGKWTKAANAPGLGEIRPRASFSEASGRTWFSYEENRVSVLDGAQLRSFSQADGIDTGIVRAIRAAGEDFWIGGDAGLGLLLRNGQFRPVRTADGRRFQTVSGIVVARDGSLWLNESRGVIRIVAEEVARFRKGANDGIRHQVYDYLDGLPGAPQVTYRSSTAIEASDGRLWFATDNGLAWIDPRSISKNLVAPPVSIVSLATERGSYAVGSSAVRLEARTSNLRIRYAALSLSAPEQVRFRYRLEGLDEEWQDAGASREAVYRNLSPGTYRFRVTACNGDGIWNNDGAGVEFAISPAWYQAMWFRAACVASVLLLLWALYRLRMAQIAAGMSARFQERLEERTRIARDLHDTLLQTVQGSKMVADNALGESTDAAQMRKALEQLSGWLSQATQEGRAALRALRGTASDRNDLSEAFARAVEECRRWSSMDVSVSIQGGAKELHPVVSDEIYRIGYEAIRNACNHSGGNRLHILLDYDGDLTMRVTDNGTGTNSAVAEQGKTGHFGMQGMRERASRIGAKFSISEVSPAAGESGTEIKLVVPGRTVFRKPPRGGLLQQWKTKLTGR